MCTCTAARKYIYIFFKKAMQMRRTGNSIILAQFILCLTSASLCPGNKVMQREILHRNPHKQQLVTVDVMLLNCRLFCNFLCSPM